MKLSRAAKQSLKDRRKATRELHSLGFKGALIPRKNKKMSYKGVKLLNPETWNNVSIFKSEALSIFMGEEFVSIDVDHPEVMCTELMNILREHKTFTVWHGPLNPLIGGKGAFVFKTSKNSPSYKKYKRTLKKSDKRILTHGYEILRGNCSQMCLGQHHEKEFYEHNGVAPIELPEEVFDYLKKYGEIRKPKKKSKEKVELKNGKGAVTTFLEGVEDVFNSYNIFLEEIKVAELNPSDECLLKIVGSDNDHHSFVLYVNKDGSCIVTTNQANFKRMLPPGKAFLKLKLPVKSTKKKAKVKKKRFKFTRSPERERELNPPKTDDLKSLITYSKCVGISASTGSGKSWTARETILDHLYDSPDNKAIYVTSDNKNARAMSLMFEDHSEIFTLNAKTSGNWQTEKKKTRLVITNQHYLTRKGITDRNHYAVMAWVNSKTLVIIDEADMLYEKMKFEQPLKFRYSKKTKKQGDEFDYIRTFATCKSSSSDGFHCEDCALCSKMAIRVNSALKQKEYTSQKVTVGAFESRRGWADLFKLLNKKGVLGEATELHNSQQLHLKAYKVKKTNDKYLNRRRISYNEDVTPFASLEDLLKCSHDAFVMINEFDEELVREKRKDFLEDNQDKTNPTRYANKALMEWMFENDMHFPYAVCNTPILKLFDMSGLRKLYNVAHRVVLLSATYSKQQMEYFEAALPGIHWLQYEGKTYKAIDRLLVITVDEEFSSSNFRFIDRLNGSPVPRQTILEKVTENSLDYLEEIGSEDGQTVFAGRTLLVQPFSNFGLEKDSAGVFNRAENRIDRFANGKFLSSNTNSRVVPNTVTYSRSALARGMNLGDYDRCITEGEAYQPADSYNWQSDGSNNLIELQTNEKVRLIMQSIGRIMRAPTIFEDGHTKQIDKLRRKVITIYNAGQSFGKRVAEILSDLCDKPAKAVHVSTVYSEDKPFPALSAHDAVQRALKIEELWLKRGKIKRIFKPEYKSTDPRINKSWSATSKDIKKRFGSSENLNRMKKLLKK